MKMMKNYTELIRLNTFEERFDYLKLSGEVGFLTFGYNRICNQMFYNRSYDWKRIRNYIILRDNGCDLGMDGHEIASGQKIFIHHINPITMKDLETNSPSLLDPENLITTIFSTHNAIHYGDKNLLVTLPADRIPNDTCPWKKGKLT